MGTFILQHNQKYVLDKLCCNFVQRSSGMFSMFEEHSKAPLCVLVACIPDDHTLLWLCRDPHSGKVNPWQNLRVPFNIHRSISFLQDPPNHWLKPRLQTWQSFHYVDRWLWIFTAPLFWFHLHIRQLKSKCKIWIHHFLRPVTTDSLQFLCNLACLHPFPCYPTLRKASWQPIFQWDDL